MGMIKLPQCSLNYFDEHYKEIFSSGNLAEGSWNKKVAEWACLRTSSPYGLAVNSNGAGLFALLRILNQYRNKEKILAQKKEYRLRNKEEIDAKKKEYRLRNREKHKAYAKEYYLRKKGERDV